jgi:hypothetical protein
MIWQISHMWSHNFKDKVIRWRVPYSDRPHPTRIKCRDLFSASQKKEHLQSRVRALILSP